MVDTNEDSVLNTEPLKNDEPVEKKKKVSPKKEGKSPAAKRTAVKEKGEAKESAKKAVIKKDNVPAKGAGSAKVFAAKGQTIDKVRKFVKGAWSELKKVHWPTRRETVAFTGVVLVAVIIVAILIFIVDTGLSRLLNLIIK